MLKVNIHCHASSPTDEDVRALSRKHGVELPIISKKDSRVIIDKDGTRIVIPNNLDSFHDAYGRTSDLIRDSADVRRVVYGNLITDAQEGCIYTQILSTGQTNRDDYVFDRDKMFRDFVANFTAIKRAIDDAYRETGIRAFASISIKRRSVKPHMNERMVQLYGNNPPEELGGLRLAHAKLDAFEHFKREMKKDAEFVTGLNMDGNETFVECGEYREIYERACGLGLMGSCHTGEKRPDTKDIWQAIDLPGIRSISHILPAIKDEKLMDTIRNKGILVEQLPIINEISSPELLGNPPRHPLPDYHRFGLRTAVGSDVPGMAGGHIDKVYQRAAEYGLTDDDLIQLTYNGCAYGLAPPEVKQILVRKVRDYAAQSGLQLLPETSQASISAQNQLKA